MLPASASLAVAAALMRESGADALPVADDGRLLGVITEEKIARAISSGGASISFRCVGDLVGDGLTVAPDALSLGQALRLMTSSGVSALPVIDGSGVVKGIVFRGDLVAYLCNVLRPPMIAGMATPLGVYLTSGALRAGPGDLGLFLSGATLMLLNDAARFVMWLVAKLFHIGAGFDALAYLASPAISVPNRLDAAHYAAIVVQAGLMLFFLRMSSLAGFHAAEHQVVNAIEAGEPLIPEAVERMSRVHPRCGTNLAAAAMLFVVITHRFTGPVALITALLIVLLFWRAIGGRLQFIFTTRRADEKQILSGIEAGKELLAKYHGGLGGRPTAWQRVWNMGFFQVAAGVASVLFAEVVVTELFGVSFPI